MYIFKIEGTFTGKPVLTIDGQSVPFETFSACYYPEEKLLDNSVLPEYTSLMFTLSSKVGNLESNTVYRVKANKDGVLTFEKYNMADARVIDAAHSLNRNVAAKPMADDEEECEDCGKVECECKDKAKSSLKEMIIQNVIK